MKKIKQGSPILKPGNVALQVEVPTYLASQWRLMWLRFRKHILALISLGIMILIAIVVLFGEFLAPSTPNAYAGGYTYAPPQRVQFIDRTENGIRVRAFVYGYNVTIDKEALRRIFKIDKSAKKYLRLFARGEPYRLWGIFKSDLHLIGPVEQGTPMYLLGADRIGRDLLTRVIYGTRISMSVGLLGVAMSLTIGILLGGISGYYGGNVDLLIQRVIEFLNSVPSIPLWMGLSAALPVNWPPLRIYFGITIILSIIGWTGLARVVRGRFLSMREEDFVLAAVLDGATKMRIMFRYMLPSFLSHLIASVTLAVPATILGETALSFLGLGLRPPVVSWGVLLQDSNNVRVIATAPWLLIPGLAVVITVLALNFLGDGLRDAADPYHR